MKWLKNGMASRLWIVIVPAILVELVSVLQFRYLHRLVEQERDTRSEIILGAVAEEVSHKLELVETTMHENLWDVRHGLVHPDSVYRIITRLIDDNSIVRGGCLAFVPGCFPSRAKLFEPYVAKTGEAYTAQQIAGPDHDYTQNPAYIKVVEDGLPVWSDPYVYGTDPPQSLTTYSAPIRDLSGNLIAVCGLDVDLSWLGDVLNARQRYPSSFCVLLTESGELVAGPPRSRAEPSEVARVVEILNGAPMDRRFCAIPRTCLKNEPHWQLAQVYYRDEVFAPLRKMRLQHLVLMLLGMAMLIWMIERYARNENKLHQASLEKARLSGELAVAAQIQASMLPQSFPDGVFGSLTPALEVGGDLYDCFVRDERIFFCIGDVSGKGIPAAMVMAEAHSLFRLVAEREDSPATILLRLNEAFNKNNDTNLFITFFAGILDKKDGTLRYCNAGHDYPVLLSKGGVSLLEARPNLPLGIFPNVPYEDESLVLGEGDALFLYTDGLTEARNPQREQFTKERMLEVLSRSAGLQPQALVETMHEAVVRFVDGAPQSDDLTLLCLKGTIS
ncbi:MAG: SpoIIE family protein phosphatase [Bacteroidales bacterium]|nr:SpoIIE family protein phosphatase [Bacteroidales bacterium]